ncbi:hypothetical protein RIR_jg36246.t1 [Rhizophagus irregularis DAOM 181602=DAOM 197198]|nr:hypothetical protein RIR_jg36246.t1 [Rhizophagus irregularis DAOM 181602=DAOM 197198]
MLDIFFGILNELINYTSRICILIQKTFLFTGYLFFSVKMFCCFTVKKQKAIFFYTFSRPKLIYQVQYSIVTYTISY